MTSIRNNFFILSLIISFLLGLVTDWYTEISIFLFIVTVFAILDKLGKGLVLRELVVLHTIFICLIMPSVGYHVYNIDNYLARIFYRFMLVPEDTYFGFTLPASMRFFSRYVLSGSRLRVRYWMKANLLKIFCSW